MNTRDLKALQAFMLSLEVGMWSGFKRKMEIAESFIQPLLTVGAAQHDMTEPDVDADAVRCRCFEEPGRFLLRPTRLPCYH